MVKQLVAILFIFCCTSVAWFILGNTIDYRTAAPADELRSQVANTWGAAHVQKPPRASYKRVDKKVETETRDGKTVERIVDHETTEFLPISGSTIGVDLQLDHRQKGLLWFSTYKVAFEGAYTITNTTAEARDVELAFPYPAAQATYDDVSLIVDGAPARLSNDGAIRTTKLMEPGATASVVVKYRSQGLDRWTYDFAGQPAQVKDFTLAMTTNFKAIDFPENTLSPTDRQEIPDGWKLNWKYSSLLTSYNVAMEMPAKLQPGPVAGQISYFAPVSLFFFFFLIFIITTLRDIHLHPVNYFFLAAAFFSFHLLLAYLVDHLSIHWSFLICSIVSVLLVTSYLRLVVDMRFALVEAAAAQVVYLVLFSYAFFFKGFTGLAVTVGSIITLFVVMQLTGKVNWNERFERAAVR